MADCKRKTANLLYASTSQTIGSVLSVEETIGSTIFILNKSATQNDVSTTVNIDITLEAGSYTLSVIGLNLFNTTFDRIFMRADDSTIIAQNCQTNRPITFTLTETTHINRLSFVAAPSSTYSNSEVKVMLNTGSTALPYEPYGWVHSLRKLTTATDTITTLPADLYADGTNATVGLVGNMYQTGTPTPQNPIQPSETGDRTANLFDKDNILKKPSTASYSVNGNTITMTGNSSATNYYYNNVLLDAGNYTIHFSSGGTNCYFILGSQFELTNARIDGRSLTMSQVVANNLGVPYAGYTGSTKETFSIYSDVPFILVFAPTLTNYIVSNIMLNAGETAKSYQPYGYKLDIKSANTTTPVYLGEVESTRQIKKLVLTGEENTWTATAASPSGRNRFYLPLESALPSDTSRPSSICSHLPLLITGGTYDTDNGYTIVNSNIYIRLTSDYNSLADFKTYLQQQYTAGTPVCVWYVLAEPTTGIVNEPLRKIGNYADTVSGISIPTITGKDTFDVQTTLKPSEVSLSYTGWHDASVGEWDGSDWQ